jgi:hypothetical protein
MSQLDPDRRFSLAWERARADWARADPALCAELAGCEQGPDGIATPYFGRPYVVTHPDGNVMLPGGRAAHPSIAIVVLHYLMTADGAPPAEAVVSPRDRWATFRQLPDGLFYAQAFAGHAEGLLAERFGNDAEGFRRAAAAVGGAAYDPAPGGGLAPPDVAYRFQAFSRVAVMVQLWEGDEEFPGRVQMLFDAAVAHYLPTEDIAGVGDWLGHKLAHA